MFGVVKIFLVYQEYLIIMAFRNVGNNQQVMRRRIAADCEMPILELTVTVHGRAEKIFRVKRHEAKSNISRCLGYETPLTVTHSSLFPSD